MSKQEQDALVPPRVWSQALTPQTELIPRTGLVPDSPESVEVVLPQRPDLSHSTVIQESYKTLMGEVNDDLNK